MSKITLLEELENEFIRQHGSCDHAKWHLGVDGDFRNVHRWGLLAVQSRADQHEYIEIENAAAQLRELIEASRNAAR